MIQNLLPWCRATLTTFLLGVPVMVVEASGGSANGSGMVVVEVLAVVTSSSSPTA
jgi:hypothetical protein